MNPQGREEEEEGCTAANGFTVQVWGLLSSKALTQETNNYATYCDVERIAEGGRARQKSAMPKNWNEPRTLDPVTTNLRHV